MDADQGRKLVVTLTHTTAAFAEKDGRSTLMVACAAGNLPLVKRLLAEGANPNHINGFGETPLTFAVAASCQSVVRHLLARQADVELPGTPGWSPLMYAAATGHHGILAILLEHGASVSRRDNAGRTALEIAKSAGHYRCVATLDLRAMIAAAKRASPAAEPRPSVPPPRLSRVGAV